MTATPLDGLINDLASFQYRPLDFVYWAFPWGEAGTELENEPGPDEWQIRVLQHLQDRMQEYRAGRYMPIRISVVSGHGVGKSALMAWINTWAFATREETRGILTAGTETQLKTKTWVEMAKWHRLYIGKSLLKLTATRLLPMDSKPGEEWRLDIIPWSEHNPAAFAGAHNKGKRLILCFDEASEIPQIIHETASGAESDKDTEIIRILFGNGTDPNGYFRETTPGGKYERGWFTFKVDSREARVTNKEFIQQEIDMHGIDSDYVRVRWLGEFAKQATDSFISRESVETAMRRTVEQSMGAMVLGVDIGFKNDPTVIQPRRGLDGTFPPNKIQSEHVEHIIAAILHSIALHDPDTVFIDVGGSGWGIYNILASKGMMKPFFYPVDFGSGPDGTGAQGAQARYANKRAEIWGGLRDWLVRGGVLRKSEALLTELVAPKYTFQKENKILLEPKQSIVTRLGRSVDEGDAYALTFAQIVEIPITLEHGSLRHARRRVPVDDGTPAAYDPFAMESIYGDSAAYH